jgi:uncharacterized protein
MKLRIKGVDWDVGNRLKCQKHGVPLAEIETLFGGDIRTAPDPNHSALERRLIGIGRTSEGRPLFVAFALRRRPEGFFVRPISARYMHKKEIEAYEKKNP